jgi:uncharacterized protein (DUF736 family)
MTSNETYANTPPPRRRSFQQKDNSGALFFVDTKKTEKHPDATGRLVIGGRTYGIAGWVRKSEAGKEYISISVSSEIFNRD